MGISESDIACSSFTATTESGDRIFARNYDFARTNTAIVGRRYMHPNINGVTVHSVVYNLTQKTVYWIGNEHYGEEDRIHRFSL